MVKILVPTDFSETAENAMVYAINLAKKLDGKIVFFHSNHLPIIMPQTPLDEFDGLLNKELESNRAALVDLVTKITKKNGFESKDYSVALEIGFAADEIPECAKKENCNLIVMGTNGASGLNYLIGSNAHAVMKNSKIPVIAVPKVFDGMRNPEKIVLATDYKKTANQLSMMNKISEKFDAEIMVLNVQNKANDKHSFEEQKEVQSIKKSIMPFKHSFHTEMNENIAESINTFASKNKAGLIVMVAHEPDFMEKLFGLSMTKEITHNSTTPVMVIPD
jgi:nucleotide-binding universal stress UspA family protein